jgi:hypothetical protein
MGSHTVLHGLLTALFALILGVAVYVYALRGGRGWWQPCGGTTDHGAHDEYPSSYRRPPPRYRPSYGPAPAPLMIGASVENPYYDAMEDEGAEAYEPSPAPTAAVDPTLSMTGGPDPVPSVAGTTPPPDGDCVPPPPPPNLDLQAIIDFSDALVTPEQREEVIAVAEDAGQIQSVNERFDAAKRKLTENRLRPGIHTNKERLKMVNNLLRRSHCSRRVRSWRTENSDILRGDVIPKRTSSSWGMMRAGRSNPDIDLHPGSMGLVSGQGGKWLSEEICPDNAVNDPL